MKTIGITGGVGAGKSLILQYLKDKYNAYVCPADEVAHILEAKGQDCYNSLTRCFGEIILDDNLEIDRQKFAALIFGNPEMLEKANAIIHPAVKKYILDSIETEKSKGTKYFILEAALLLEEGYDKILDEIWYIYAGENTRRRRLKESRGYSDEKIDAIFSKQLTEEEYRSGCKYVLNNDDTPDKVKKEIDILLSNGAE